MDLSRFADFHFLRPAALLLLVPITLLYAFLLWQQGGTMRRWRKVIAPHLLEHLLLGAGHKTLLRPLHLLAVLMLLTCLAAAGPSWQQEESPFTADEAPLVIAIDLSTSMRAVDVRPSRYERARQKVRDLVENRQGAKTALVAYAGTAHMVLPLTDDPEILTTYVEALSPDLMPEEGKNASAALAVAEEILAKETAAGTILFLTDGIPAQYRAAFVDGSETSQHQVVVLALGTLQGGPIPLGEGRFATDENGVRILTSLDREGFEELSKAAGTQVLSFTVDDSDLRRLGRIIQSHLVAARLDDPSQRWRDEGYWLTIPVLLLALLWFRPGWLVTWEDA